MPPKTHTYHKPKQANEPASAVSEGKTYTDKEIAEITATAKAESDDEASEKMKNESELLKARAKADAMKELAQEADEKSVADHYVPKPGGEKKTYFSKTAGRCLVWAAFDRLGKDKKGPEAQFQGHLYPTDDENLQNLIEAHPDFKNGKVYLINADVADKLSGKAKTQYVGGAATTVSTPESQKEPAIVK